MRAGFLSFFLIMMLTSLSFAQLFQEPYKELEGNMLDGGVGFTWIDGQPYTTLTLAPDISLGKVGVGLYLQLLFDNNNSFKFRKDEYQGDAGILRAIRYIRYGHRYDPIYLRIGSLERSTLGNGFLMWNYNNGSNYDKRKIGFEVSFDFGKAGIETVVGSLTSSSVQGYNVFVRPFRFSSSPIPILSRLRVYGTYVRDNKVASGVLLDSTATLQAYGFGTDLRWLDLPVLKSAIYADFAKIDNFGNGKAIGINAVIPNVIGIFAVGARFEKRFLNEGFIPNLFGPLYELDRNLGIFTRLQNTEKTEGYFGELSGHVLHKILLVGNFQKLNGIENSGILHLEATAPNLVPKFELRGYYDKTGIQTFDDARTLDNRSVLTAEVGYQLNRYLLLSMIYRWYWIEQPDNPGVFKPIERVEPRLSFRYRF